MTAFEAIIAVLAGLGAIGIADVLFFHGQIGVIFANLLFGG